MGPTDNPILDAYAVNGGAFPGLVWGVGAYESGPALGQGMINLETGKNGPVPPNLSDGGTTPSHWTLTDANNTPYFGSGHEVYRYSQGTMMPLGKVPDVPVAVGTDGSLWAFTTPDQGNPHVTMVVRELPGQSRVENWTVWGTVLSNLYGPGYIGRFESVQTAQSGMVFQVIFPAQHQTIDFKGLLTPTVVGTIPTGPGDFLVELATGQFEEIEISGP